MEEKKYHIREVSGSSMGAIIAGGIALWMNSQEIYAFTQKEFSYWKLVNFSFWKWLLSGEKVVKMLQWAYGKAKVSHTQIPLKIVATRLEDMEKIVFTDTSILDAVRASMSIPWIFQPHVIHGKHYVDAMLSENLPLSVLEGDNIIAISSTMGLKTDISSTRNILTKSFNKALYNNENYSLKSCEKILRLIRPSYDEVDFFDFHKFEDIVKIWYQEAKKILESD